MSLLVASPTPISPRRSACANVLAMADSFSSPVPFVQTTCASPVPHILRAASPVHISSPSPPPPAPVMLHLTVSPYTVIYSVFSPTLSISATSLKSELVGNPMFRYIYDADLVAVCRVLSIARDNPGEVFSVCVRWKAPWETRYVLTELEINCAIGEFVFDVMVRRSNDLKLPAVEYGVHETVKRRLSRVDQLVDEEGGYWSGAEDNGEWDDDVSQVSDIESIMSDDDDDEYVEETEVVPQIARRVSSVSLPQLTSHVTKSTPLRSEIVMEESEEESEETETEQVIEESHKCTDCTMDCDTDVGYDTPDLDSGATTCYYDSDSAVTRAATPDAPMYDKSATYGEPIIFKPVASVALPSVTDTLMALLESMEHSPKQPPPQQTSPLARFRTSIEAVIGFGVEAGFGTWNQFKRHSGWV